MRGCYEPGSVGGLQKLEKARKMDPSPEPPEGLILAITLSEACCDL